MDTLFLGIDDAGRGPVIGPMILAGCLIDKKTETELRDLGVRDSKQLTPKRRKFLEEKIREKATNFHIEVITPDEIDGTSASGINLNELEAIFTSKIINKINKNSLKINVVIDCPSVNRTQWGDSVKMKIGDLSNLDIHVEHKADRDHISVAAASILAKEERERQVAKIVEEHGEVGSGYPSDPKTKKFLDKNAIILKDKGIFRKTWSTWQNAVSKQGQKKLDF